MTVRGSRYFLTTVIACSLFLLPGGASAAEEKAESGKPAAEEASAAPEAKPLPDKVASVNGVAISGDQLSKELDIYLQRVGRPQAAMPASQLDQVRAEILDGLIDQELLYQESRKLGIQIEDKAVNEQFEAIRQRFPDESQFKQALASMQMSEMEAKQQIERGLAIREVIDRKVADKVTVDDAESKAFYDENPQFFMQPERVKASHILIKVDPSAADADKAAAREKLQDLRKQAEGGADFAELAKTHSEGPSNERGGDLGFFQRGQMVKPFEDAAFALEKDQLSEIVETRYGYHLIKVTDKQPEKKFSYDEVKERLTERLKQDKVEKEARAYIDSLKEGAEIEKFL